MHDTDARDSSDSYENLHRVWRWRVPDEFNIAEACCTRWAASGRNALRWEDEGGASGRLSYAELEVQARAFAAGLAARGVGRGDRVAIVLAQRPETAVAQMGVAMLGALAMPLSVLFGPEALVWRLADSGARVAVADEATLAHLLRLRAECPALELIVGVGAAEGDADCGWRALLAAGAAGFEPARTRADDAAVLIYTSGTTGPPKGVLIPHRALLGNLPGFVCSQNGFAGEAVFWSPADWAWTGGLMDALLPTLFFGREIVAFRGRFQPERAFELMQRHGVTHTFLFPTALKAMMKAVPAPAERYALKLEAVMSAGEAVGDAVFAWCRDALGVPVNEMFGQTEMNYLVGNCARSVDEAGLAVPGWPARPGSMGRAYPGHRVAVIDDEGRECPPGVPGDVALHRLDRHGDPDPIFFLGYWRNEAATRAKYTGDPAASWCRTGDTAVMDADGYLWYQGRSDDVFKAAGYRIGPSEIENCLVKHAAVANAAVVPKPDAERGAVVKAYVVLAPGVQGDAALVGELQQHVRERLAPYEYPKEIEFIEALPMTTTGKVQRRVLRLQEEERARQRGGG
ncbi:acyl-CoA synthetase [Rubrivivax gelatinosus]|uniref:Acetyl-coenzyme A synthetase AcsA n=1 Tax=Rubrivivax gelatinosus (strain NBRC 100245 / IL144) TaxID=983917 RepID=I0HQA7_RUBGI|nr:AMP-binding protein [Rubrivivax gelatinosus]BAL95194.1 acetyl-coenzyme A synthetase AcsA [Rubrivivax gelatinosus IL144]